MSRPLVLSARSFVFCRDKVLAPNPKPGIAVHLPDRNARKRTSATKASAKSLFMTTPYRNGSIIAAVSNGQIGQTLPEIFSLLALFTWAGACFSPHYSRICHLVICGLAECRPPLRCSQCCAPMRRVSRGIRVRLPRSARGARGVAGAGGSKFVSTSTQYTLARPGQRSSYSISFFYPIEITHEIAPWHGLRDLISHSRVVRLDTTLTRSELIIH